MRSSEPTAPAFETVARSSVGAGVVERIKAMIANGDLPPGARLPSQRALSVSLGVSLPTVREAIRSLNDMGLLDARHGSGTYVTALQTSDLISPVRFALTLTDRSMAQLFDVRVMLEPAAARVAAERRSEPQLKAMRECVAHSKVEGTSSSKLLELDLKLHRLVVEASQNPLLAMLMDSIVLLGIESRERTVNLPGVEPETIHDHENIVRAIATRRGAAAEKAMRHHIERIQNIAAAAGLPARSDSLPPSPR